jgi:Single-strand binding protein family
MSMAADNHTTIIGNLVEDPEVRFTNNGIAVTNLRVAVTQRVQQDGQWRDGDTSFFKVNVWRGQPTRADRARVPEAGTGHVPAGAALHAAQHRRRPGCAGASHDHQ